MNDDPLDLLALADWRRRVADLYAGVRALLPLDAERAWEAWREGRDRLYREHSQSPVPASERARFTSRYWPYDPDLHFEVEVTGATVDAGEGLAGRAPALGATPILPMSHGDGMDFAGLGHVEVPFPAGRRRLTVFWMRGYAGGLFLPFRDATNGAETYGAGRYLLDAAKSADLGSLDETSAAPGTRSVGGGGAGASPSVRSRLILDFNFAYQPSCAFDPRWACPLSPPENRLDLRIEAGERIA